MTSSFAMIIPTLPLLYLSAAPATILLLSLLIYHLVQRRHFEPCIPSSIPIVRLRYPEQAPYANSASRKGIYYLIPPPLPPASTSASISELNPKLPHFVLPRSLLDFITTESLSDPAPLSYSAYLATLFLPYLPPLPSEFTNASKPSTHTETVLQATKTLISGPLSHPSTLSHLLPILSQELGRGLAHILPLTHDQDPDSEARCGYFLTSLPALTNALSPIILSPLLVGPSTAWNPAWRRCIRNWGVLLSSFHPRTQTSRWRVCSGQTRIRDQRDILTFRGIVADILGVVLEHRIAEKARGVEEAGSGDVMHHLLRLRIGEGMALVERKLLFADIVLFTFCVLDSRLRTGIMDILAKLCGGGEEVAGRLRSEMSGGMMSEEGLRLVGFRSEMVGRGSGEFANHYKILANLTLPDGTILPRNTHLAFSQRDFHHGNESAKNGDVGLNGLGNVFEADEFFTLMWRLVSGTMVLGYEFGDLDGVVLDDGNQNGESEAKKGMFGLLLGKSR